MADLRPQHNEEVVGANHPTKADIANRAWNIEHDVDGTHKLPIPPGTEMIFIQNAAPTGWTRNAARQDNAMLCYASAGNPASGGEVNPQSTHTHTGPSHTHTGPSHTHTGPSHLHHVFHYNGAASTDYIYNSGGNYVSISWGVKTQAGVGGIKIGGYNEQCLIVDAYSSLAGTGATGAEGTGATGAEGTGATGANAAPYYQEVISATKD